ncbi:VOC family protein [Kribbella sp. NPDC056951]|uniref:VOC family protein n=1 Tax=Kribbella sp. NPDC056951 TaxID=3345978 RepID=UPI0036441F05
MAHLLADDAGMTVYIGCPRLLGGEDGGTVLSDFYLAVLGWPRYDAYGTFFLSRSPKFRIGFDGDGWSEQRPPRWPDPEYPQQLHFDIAVPDLDAAGTRVTAAGGVLLRDDADHRVYADPTGHPICLYPSEAVTAPTVARLVYDCFSPRSLARFYEGFLGAPERLEDSPERVVLDLGDDDLPNPAFQHAEFPAPRWPDPAYPAQLHVDYRFTVDYETPHYLTPAAKAAMARAEELGAIHLRNAVYADPAGHPFCF